MSRTTTEMQLVPVERLVPYANNARVHSPEQILKIRSSLREFGFINPVIIDADFGIIAGHGRVMAAKAEGIAEVPCVLADHLTPAQKKAYILADNKLAEDAGWDEELLRLEIEALQELDYDTSFTGFDEFELKELLGGDWSGESGENIQGSLAERFLFAPFSVLDSRRKDWQDRKNFWIKTVGIKSSETRENIQSCGAFSGNVPRYYDYKGKCEKILGRELTNKEFEENYLQDYLPKDSNISTTDSGGILSIFDPVLCELMYYWFCPEGGRILDPFAGGNVRGLVAAFTDHGYTGVDIRQDQIEANISSASQLLKDKTPPRWICGNSLELDSLVDGSYDMIFSCPPYFDLEKYSDNPADISNMTYEDFLDCYRAIIKKAAAFLKDNRFAVFVVGDVRNRKTGMYRNFVSETISAFHAAGVNLYNEIILVTQAGSLPIRTSKNFQAGRKVGKTHQNILVFYKGSDQKKIGDVFKDIKILEIEENY